MSCELICDIPHGNCACYEISSTEKFETVMFSAHPHGGTESLWWCFRIFLRFIGFI